MRSMLGRTIMLTGALVAIFSAVGVSSAGAVTCTNIGGAGSSLQNLAQTETWIPSWLVSACSTKTSVTYRSTSSGNGMRQWGSGGVQLEEFEPETPLAAFVGSDAAASSAQMENMSTTGAQPTKDAGIVAVPVAQSAIAEMVSLPIGCKPVEKHPRPSNTKLVKAWETDLISFAELMETTGTCASLPTLLVASGSSGTTAVQKRYFATLTDSPEWLELLSKAENVEWPKEVNSKVVRCCETEHQMALRVYDTSGTLGYANLADAGGVMSVAWSKHTVGSESFWSGIIEVEAGGEFVSPEAANEESNCEKAKYENQASKMVKPGEDWSTAKQKNVNEAGVYPVCTLTFDLAWKRYETKPLEPLYGGSKGSAEATANTVRDYLRWIINSSIPDGGQLVLNFRLLHYGKLPTEVKSDAEKGITKANIE